MSNRRNQDGFALVTVMMLLAMLGALLSAHFLLTRADLSTTRSSMDRTKGFYAAEAGLNLRAQLIRNRFEQYNRPSGSPPPQVPGQLPCESGPTGSGDFGCVVYSFKGRDVRTYVEEDATNPVSILIPPLEPFQNLNAQEYGYTVNSVAVTAAGRPEAILEMRFKSRLVPLFQFAAFYNKDLEIYPGPPMTLDGPVHCNGDLYAGAEDGLTLNGQVTVAHDGSGFGGRLFNGRKFDDCCSSSEVRVYDGASPRVLPSDANRYEVLPEEQAPWGGWIRSKVDPVTVPSPDALDASPGRLYWDRADVRIVLDLDANEVQIRDADGNKNTLAGDTLATCPGNAPGGTAVGQSSSLRNMREGKWIRMLEVDAGSLLNCLQNHDLMGGKTLDDTTDGGLVWYLGVDGPTPTGSPNAYGVRVTHGLELASTAAGAPEIQGLTVVTNQAVYIEGDYNADPDNWKPAAFLADSLNILSNSWDDEDSDQSLSGRVASDTEIYAAFLSGTDSTGDVELSPISGSDNSIYNGGLENYPRLHESWTGRTLLYRGSFVSLDRPRHVEGIWDDQSYDPPARDWRYELRFNDARNLPPLTPRFIYLTQELFVREFEY